MPSLQPNSKLNKQPYAPAPPPLHPPPRKFLNQLMELQNPVRRGLTFSSRPRGPRHSDISGPQTAEKLAGLREHALWPRQGRRPAGMRHSARTRARVARTHKHGEHEDRKAAAGDPLCVVRCLGSTDVRRRMTPRQSEVDFRWSFPMQSESVN